MCVSRGATVLLTVDMRISSLLHGNSSEGLATAASVVVSERCEGHVSGRTGRPRGAGRTSLTGSRWEGSSDSLH